MKLAFECRVWQNRSLVFLHHLACVVFDYFSAILLHHNLRLGVRLSTSRVTLRRICSEYLLINKNVLFACKIFLECSDFRSSCHCFKHNNQIFSLFRGGHFITTASVTPTPTTTALRETAGSTPIETPSKKKKKKSLPALLRASHTGTQLVTIVHHKYVDIVRW